MEHSQTRIPCVAPATGAFIAEVAVSDADAVQAAFDAARTAQAEWSQRSVRDRAAALLKFRDVLVAQGPDLAALLSLECGKPEMEAFMSEVFTLADLTTYFCKKAPGILKDQGISLHLMKHRRSVIHGKALSLT